MGSFGRKQLGLGLAAALGIAGVIGVTSPLASGSGAGTGPAMIPYGTLTIDLAERAGTLTFVRASDQATFTQALSANTPCSTLVTEEVLPRVNEDEPNSGDLLTFTPTGGTNPNVQLPDNGIGVTDGANCGTPAGLIGPGETLKLSLGSFVPEDVRIGSGTLQIGKTHPQDRSLQLAYDDTGFGGDISIADGGQPIAIPNGTNASSVTLGSTATQSSRGLSVRGGTTFDLVAPSGFETAVFCGEDEEKPGGDGDVAQSATFLRLENSMLKDGGNIACEDVGVTVTITDSYVLWDNDTLGAATGSFQDVQALFTIEWEGVISADFNRLEREINYEGVPGGPLFPVQWCTSFQLIFDEETETTTASAVRPVGPIDEDEDGEEISGVVPWCLVSVTEELRGGFVFQTEMLFGAGDPLRTNTIK